MSTFASQTRRALQFLPQADTVDTVGWIFGTWDFKWPQGKKLRIAFQALPPGQNAQGLLDAAISRFYGAINQWKSSEFQANISWCSPEEAGQLPAPKDAQSVASVLAQGAEIKYDILVSFAGLPLTLLAPKLGADAPVYSTQTSELGSYASRIDYGTPTLFLGPDALPDAGWNADEIFKWVQSQSFVAAAVHEFGHALGLAHAHQNPLYRRDSQVELKTREEISAILDSKQRFRRFPRNDIDFAIRNTWSYARRGTREPLDPVLFSDWLPPPSADKALEEQSCMAHPGWSMFIKGASTEGEPEELRSPTAYDLTQLAALYPMPQSGVR